MLAEEELRHCPELTMARGDGGAREQRGDSRVVAQQGDGSAQQEHGGP